MLTGTVLALGSMNVYITSYFRQSLEYDVNQDLFDKMLPLCLIFTTLTYPIGNRLVDTFDGQSRPVIVIGAILGLSMFYSCAVIRYNPYTFVFVWCFGMGIMKGFFLSSIYRAGWSHLPTR
jgi:MFS family permease